MKQPIRRIFIANRGEIARRIAQSAKRLGLETVAITDKKQPPIFLQGLIDIFHLVEEETTALYLNSECMLSIASQYQCQAIHPGFGFLSENSGFARAVIEAGLIWIGPSPETIEMMASKAKAREIAESINAPCVPGLRVDSSIDAIIESKHLSAFTSKAGYPILIKAALGGGGKGMRVVHSEGELKNQLERAASEALSSFGDASLIIEKYLEKPRHVEVQIFGDQSGNIVTFGDRDCSLQRRHQKIIEEAPAPFLHETTRQRLHDIALDLAKKVSYYSAGTVEFLVDGPSTSEQSIYFLEMNTRLQVEHPVSEQVYGLDLVALQFEVAMGKSLSTQLIQRSKMPALGHSIEARIYAEDPLADFFPAAADIHAFIPHTGPGIRWEVGVDCIDSITTKFDPMIAKLVVHASNRTKALQLLQTTLSKTILAGPKTNISFLSLMCKDSNFHTENFDTFYISRCLDELKIAIKNLQDTNWQKLTFSPTLIDKVFAGKKHTDAFHFTSRAFNLTSPLENHIKLASRLKKTSYPQAETQTAVIDGYAIEALGSIPIAITRTASEDRVWMNIDGFISEQLFHRFNKGGGEATHAREFDITAPVPGKIVKLNCFANDQVKTGQTLLILESMKMEIEVKAPFDCQIDTILIRTGDQVEADQTLMQLVNQNETS